MQWECSECGYSADRTLRPHVCPGCGTATASFAKAEPGIEGDANAETLFESWLMHGMERRPRRARPSRHHGLVHASHFV